MDLNTIRDKMHEVSLGTGNWELNIPFTEKGMDDIHNCMFHHIGRQLVDEGWKVSIDIGKNISTLSIDVPQIYRAVPDRELGARLVRKAEAEGK